MNKQRRPFIPNPVLGGLLGICPLAAAANSLVNGCVLGLGAAVSAVVIGLAMPFLQSFVPDRLRTPCSLTLSAAIALLIGAGVEAFSPSTARGLGVYITLLTVNCLSLQALRHNPFALDREGRIFGSQYGLGRTTLLKESFGYIGVAVLIGALREALGAGTLSFSGPGVQWFFLSLSDDSPARLFSAPAGGFILLGCLTALYRIATGGRGRKAA